MKNKIMKIILLIIIIESLIINFYSVSAMGQPSIRITPPTSLIDYSELEDNSEETQGEATGGIIDPNDFKPNIGLSETKKVTRMAQKIVGIINVVGTIILVATIIILGIKYMLGSIEERSEYKKTMWPILIGAILLFGVSWILKILYNIVPSTL